MTAYGIENDQPASANPPDDSGGEISQSQNKDQDRIYDQTENGDQEKALDRSISDLISSYPGNYFKIYSNVRKNIKPIIHFGELNFNVVQGDNIGGVVGPDGSVNSDEISVGNSFSRQRIKVREKTPKNIIKGWHITSAASVEKWFFNQKDIDCQLHLLLVSIFAGNTFRFITSARENIKRSFIEKKDEAELSTLSITNNMSTILKETLTRQVKHEYTVESGKTHLNIIEFVEEDAQKHILKFLRSSINLDTLRNHIDELLITICLIDHIDLHMMGTPLIDLTRSQAALGLGELAKSDYEYYLTRIIRPWANSSDPFVRYLVGWVLLALGTENKYLTAIFSLLRHWSKASNSRLQWTAAAACSRIGLIDLDQTLNIIKTLLSVETTYIRKATGISIGLLYLSANNDIQIVLSFADWIKTADISKDEDLIFVSNITSVFLYITEGRFEKDLDPTSATVDDEKNNSHVDLWQLGSRLSGQNKVELEESLVIILRQCFRHRSAGVVDRTCDLIERIIAGSETNFDPNEDTPLLNVLSELLTDSVAARHIRVVLNRCTLRGNSIVSHLVPGT